MSECSIDSRPGSLPQRHPPTAAEITKLLTSVKSVAVIGLSDDPSKPAYEVADYLKKKGYRIFAIHPKAQTALGEPVHTSLMAIAEPVDLVYMFRGADAAPGVVEDAIKKGVQAVWMPEGIVNEDAADRGRAAGLTVVMDRCARKELGRS